jgi:hypothetical protein
MTNKEIETTNNQELPDDQLSGIAGGTEQNVTVKKGQTLKFDKSTDVQIDTLTGEEGSVITFS